MKKYIILGLLIVLVGVSGALILRANSSNGCLQLKGLQGTELTAKTLSKWLKSSDDMLLEVQGKRLYLQEAIGSESVSLTNPAPVSGNFIFKFDLKSLTLSARIQLTASHGLETPGYSIELQQLPDKKALRIRKDGVLLKETEADILQPDVFYKIQLERINHKLSLFINDEEVISVFTDNQPEDARLSLKIEGKPGHPAAIEIKNAELYE